MLSYVLGINIYEQAKFRNHNAAHENIPNKSRPKMIDMDKNNIEKVAKINCIKSRQLVK